MGKPEDRKMQLGLTNRQAGVLASLLRQEKAKRARALAKSTFKPAPGQFDNNKMRVSMMEDLLGQLEAFDWNKP